MIKRSLTGTKVWIWEQDGAIDKDHPDYDHKAFAADFDEKHMPILDGQTPARFTIAPLTKDQFVWAMGQSSGLPMMIEAVAYGLRSVVGYEVDGKPVEIQTKRADHGQRMTKATLDAIFEPELFADLGIAILGLSKLDPLRR